MATLSSEFHDAPVSFKPDHRLIVFTIQGLSSEGCGQRTLPSTYFSILTWVQVQFCKNSYYFYSSNFMHNRLLKKLVTTLVISVQLYIIVMCLNRSQSFMN